MSSQVTFRFVPQSRQEYVHSEYIRVVRFVGGVETGSCIYEVFGVPDGFGDEEEFIQACEALGKHLRLSGDFHFFFDVRVGPFKFLTEWMGVFEFANGCVQSDLFDNGGYWDRSVRFVSHS